MSKEKDYTSIGTRMESQYENDRNADSKELFKAIVREVYCKPGAEMDVIVGHHISYEWREKRGDSFVYTFVQEIPSADALIFDHDVAKKLWGANYMDVLMSLAVTPTDRRDQVLADHYYNRGTCPVKRPQAA